MTDPMPDSNQIYSVIHCLRATLNGLERYSDEAPLDKLIALLQERHSQVLGRLALSPKDFREHDDQVKAFTLIIEQDPEILVAVRSFLIEFRGTSTSEYNRELQFELKRHLDSEAISARQPDSNKKFRFDSVDELEPQIRTAGGDSFYDEDFIDIEASSRSVCSVRAEIDPSVVVNRVTTVEVTIALGQLEQWITTATTQSGSAEIDTDKILIIQVLPKANFEAVDADRIELDSQTLAQSEDPTVTLYFDLRPTHVGEGEIWVILRQGQVSLLTLTLAPEIVESRQLRTVFSAMAISDSSSHSSEPKLSATGSVDKIPQLSQPLHQLRIFEQRNGTEVNYYYELQSPQLDIWETYRSDPIRGDRERYVENLYSEIESRWRTAQSDPASFDAELRAFGGQLFDELFPLKLQQRLWNHRHTIESILVVSTEPFIPWELIHLKQPGENRLPDETCFLGQLGLVRWLHDAGWAPERIQIRRDRAYYAIPRYPANSGYRLPHAEAEAQFLQQHFGAVAVTPQPSPVRDLICSGSFDLLHFACHGSADHSNIANAKLLMQGYVQNDNRYVVNELSATTIEQYSRLNQDGNRPIVVLNSCQTGRTGYTFTGVGGFARAFLKGGAGVFVGALWSVGDRSARTFTEKFYTALLDGSTLSESTIQARETARRSGDATWLAYAVYGHPYMRIQFMRNSKKKET